MLDCRGARALCGDFFRFWWVSYKKEMFNAPPNSPKAFKLSVSHEPMTPLYSMFILAETIVDYYCWLVWCKKKILF